MEYAVSDFRRRLLRARRAAWSSAAAHPQTVWFRLFVGTRAVAAAVAPLLLLFQLLHPSERLLAAAGIAYGAGTILLLARFPPLQTAWWVWCLDALAVFGLIIACGDWRSPFYLLLLTVLILPTTTLPPRRALEFGAGFAASFCVGSVFGGVDWNAVASTLRLETYTAHLLTPLLVTVALAYAADLLRSLEAERARSERLALEAE